jgi:hypothetical protein
MLTDFQVDLLLVIVMFCAVIACLIVVWTCCLANKHSRIHIQRQPETRLKFCDTGGQPAKPKFSVPFTYIDVQWGNGTHTRVYYNVYGQSVEVGANSEYLATIDRIEKDYCRLDGITK